MADDLKEYADEQGHTFLLNEADAETFGYKAVESKRNKQAQRPTNKSVEPELKK